MGPPGSKTVIYARTGRRALEGVPATALAEAQHLLGGRQWALYNREGTAEEASVLFVWDRGNGEEHGEPGPFGDDRELPTPIESPLVSVHLDDICADYCTFCNYLLSNLGWLSALEIDIHHFESAVGRLTAEIHNALEGLRATVAFVENQVQDLRAANARTSSFVAKLHSDLENSGWKPVYEQLLPQIPDYFHPQRSLQAFFPNEKVQALRRSLESAHDELSDILLRCDTWIRNLPARFEELRTQAARLEAQFKVTPDDYRLEEQMLAKSNTMIQSIRDDSRQLLEESSSPDSHSTVATVHRDLVSHYRNEGLPMLFTITCALRNQVNELMDLKEGLQRETKPIYTQLSSILAQTGNKTRDRNISRLLEHTKDLQSSLIQTRDIVLVYGQYILEYLRKTVWFYRILQHILSFDVQFDSFLQQESKTRALWLKDYGYLQHAFQDSTPINEGLALLDDRFFDDNRDFNQLYSFCNANPESIKNLLSTIDHRLSTLRNYFETYLKDLRSFDVLKDTFSILSKSFEGCSSFELPCPTDYQHSNDDRIRGLRLRINKLESLLLQSKMLNSTTIRFQTSNSVKDSRILGEWLNNPTNAGDGCSSKIMNWFEEPHAEFSHLHNDSEATKHNGSKQDFQSALVDRETRIKILNDKVTDLDLEIQASREIQTNLNKLIANLLYEKEGYEDLRRSNELQYSKDIQKLAEQNSHLLAEVAKLKKEKLDLDTKNSQLMNQKNEIEDSHKVELHALQDKFDNELAQMKASLQELQHENSALKNKTEVENLTKDDNDSLQDTDYTDAASNSPPQALMMKESKDSQTLEAPAPLSNSVDTAEVSQHIDGKHMRVEEDGDNLSELVLYANLLENKIFDIFTTSVFILENIGLLLIEDSKTGAMRIIRVKGLKKRSIAKISGESASLMENDCALKSRVFSRIKERYDKSFQHDIMMSCKSVIEEIGKLYDNSLFGSAVVDRFRNIETLAKKLTKESKNVHCSSQQYRPGMLAIDNFAIGDMVLFLPVDDCSLSVKSSNNSTDSSFSSVDLTSPPPYTIMSTLSSKNDEKASKLHSKVVNRRWAAFTWQERETRYLLKAGCQIPEGREWFIGKITDISPVNAANKLMSSATKSDNLTWYELTAIMVTNP